MNAQQNAYMQLTVPLAQAAQKKWGVLSCISEAQSILESSNRQGWGQSELARVDNNFFGIKAEHLDDPNTYCEFRTPEFIDGKPTTIVAKFERYYEPAESFDDHARLLATAKRYAPAMAVRNDPMAFAQQLQLCGYSSSPTYAAALVRLIEMYDLTQYDIQPDGPAAAQAAA
jgi:flagellum-specific peptidoglycan hydrolase FlgJ